MAANCSVPNMRPIAISQLGQGSAGKHVWQKCQEHEVRGNPRVTVFNQVPSMCVCVPCRMMEVLIVHLSGRLYTNQL